MELKIIGSSSAGNCYVFDNGKEALVVECGISFTKVKEMVNFDISRIVGCLVSHEHGDHAKYINDIVRARIMCYMSAGTKEAILNKTRIESYSLPMLTSINVFEPFNIGSFKIKPFDVQHDAAEPFGFLIYHPEMGTVLFATDTYYVKYKFSGLNNILIECNYCEKILLENVKQGVVNGLLLKRTLQSHMSYDTCLETLLANDLSEVNNIVLIHLSDGNSNALDFKQGIQRATGKTVHIANKNMTLEFNKTPF